MTTQQIIEVMDTKPGAAIVRMVQSIFPYSPYPGNGPAGPEYYPWPILKRRTGQISTYYWGA